MEKNKVLLVEDDTNFGQVLKNYLELNDFIVELARDGILGLAAFRREKFDICLLDVMMPNMDGFTLAEEIRNVDPDVPLFFLSAKSMKEDTIEGFNAGGDDYITKPFSMEELLVRINAVLRRTNKVRSTESEEVNFKIGNYQFNTEKQILQNHGTEQKLTTKESQLLRLLCLHKNDVLDRNFALKTIWHDDNYFNGRSMDVYIAKLRKYLKDDSKVEIINIHGKGFKLLVNS